MNTNITKIAASRTVSSTTFFGLRVAAICQALVTLGVILGISLGAVDAAKGQPRGRTYARTDIERFIRDVEQSSQEFQRAFDTWLDRSRLDGQQREDIYNRQVQNLTSALSTLRSNFNSRNDWWASRNDMQRVLSAATSVDSIMRNREVRGGLNRQWGRLRANLNTLANAFNLPQVGTTFAGIQTYPEYGGNVRACTLTGTFRGYTNSGESEIAIAANGAATARSLTSNETYNGRCANDVLYFDWGSFNIVRERGGMSTVEIGNERNRTSYRRISGQTGDIVQTYPGQPYPGQGYPDQAYPGQVGNVPTWAIGTFRGMTDNGESELSIGADGTATIRALNTNKLYTGRYANGVLTFDWGSFNLTRDRSGISTVEIGREQNRTPYRRIN